MSDLGVNPKFELYYSGSWHNVTSKVPLKRGGKIERGRGRRFDKVQPGTCEFTLDNDGEFSNLPINTPVRVTGALSGSLSSSGTPTVFGFGEGGFGEGGFGVGESGGDPDPSGFPLFYGYLDAVPVSWQGRTGYMAVSATDRLKLLGRGSLQPVQVEIAKFDGASMVYPLSESGSETVSDVLGNGPNGTLAAGKYTPADTTVIELGAAGPAPTGETALALTGGTTSGQPYGGYVGFGTGPLVTALPFTVSAWVRISSPSGGLPYVIWAQTTPEDRTMEFSLDSTGAPRFAMVGAFGFEPITSPSALTLARWHQVTLTIDEVSTVSIFVDGVLKVTQVLSQAPTQYFAADVKTGLGAAVHPTGASWFFNGRIASVEFYDDILPASRIAAHYHAGGEGFAGDSPADRLTRISGYTGLSPTLTDFAEGLSTLGYADIAGKTPLDAMQQVEASEQGFLFVDASGDLVFLDRYDDLNRDVSFALTGANIDPDLTIVKDDTNLENDVEVIGLGAGPARRKNQDSIDAVGLYAVSVDTALSSLAEMQGLADYRVARNGIPRPQTPALKVDAVTQPSFWPAVLGCELGQRFTVDDLLPQSPDSDYDLIVQKLTHEFTSTSWTLTVQSAKRAKLDVLMLDSGDTYDSGKVVGW